MPRAQASPAAQWTSSQLAVWQLPLTHASPTPQLLAQPTQEPAAQRESSWQSLSTLHGFAVTEGQPVCARKTTAQQNPNNPFERFIADDLLSLRVRVAPSSRRRARGPAPFVGSVGGWLPRSH